MGGSGLNLDHIQRCQMIRLKKGKGVFVSFLLSGFSMMFFSYGPSNVCCHHACRWAIWRIENYYIFIL